MTLPIRALREFCSIIQGGRHGLSGNDFVPVGYPAYGAGGMNGCLDTYEFDETAIVLSSIGARCGKCFFVEGRWSSLANTQVIFPDKAQADPRFLWFQLNDERRWHRSGTGQPFIKPSDVKEHKVYLPSLADQRRIAAILDQADALRAKRRESLTQIKTLKQSIFLDMFGDAQSVYKRWTVKPLVDFLDFLTSGSRGWAEYYADAGAIFLRIQNVCHDELDLSDVAYVAAPDSAEARRTEVREGDVLLSITADLGRTAVVPSGLGKAHINQHLSILRTNSIAPGYLSAFLSSTAGQREVMGRNKQGVKAGLNFDDIRSFRIPVPPTAIQQKFLQRTEEINRHRLLQSTSLRATEQLFSSLQHRAFRGEL